MHLDHEVGRAAGPLVQAVDVLRDQRVQQAAVLELDERAMPGPWLRRPRGVMEPPLPGELPHLGIGHVVVDVREPLGFRVLRPDALRAAEVGDAGVGRDAGARQRDDARGTADPVADELRRHFLSSGQRVVWSANDL